MTTQTPKCPNQPLTVVGDEGAEDRQKRERQISEGSENPAERKTVRIVSFQRPSGCPVDEPYGTTKLEIVKLEDGRGAYVRRQSLSENEKG